MRRTMMMKTGAVLGACAAVGAGAGLLGSAGAAVSSKAPAARAARATRARRAGRAGPLARAVHGTLVVPGRRGTFRTLTIDRGVVKSVAGDQLTITEGTRRATYRTVTLTIPAGAVVRDDRQAVALTALKPGQRVMVLSGTPREHVVAHDARARRTP